MAEIMHSNRVQARLNKAIQRQLDKVERRCPPRKIRVQIEPANRKPFKRKELINRPRGHLSLPKYDRPIIDSKGRQSIVMTVDYDGSKRHAFGIIGRRIVYISDPEHCELDGSGQAIIFSNMGSDLAEILHAAEVHELGQRTSRADAKLGLNIVIQMPHDVPTKVREKILRAVSHELFGRHGLPYAASLHRPDPDGDPRNYHGHIWGSWRPMTRTAPYCWDIAQDFRADLDGRDYWRHARRRVAEIMTSVLHREGTDRHYTHLSNAERGLPHKPQKNLDKRKTRSARAGEFVADVVAMDALIKANVAHAEKLEAKREERRKRELKRRVALLSRVSFALRKPLNLSTVSVVDRDDRTISQVTGGPSFAEAGTALRTVKSAHDHPATAGRNNADEDHPVEPVAHHHRARPVDFVPLVDLAKTASTEVRGGVGIALRRVHTGGASARLEAVKVPGDRPNLVPVSLSAEASARPISGVAKLQTVASVATVGEQSTNLRPVNLSSRRSDPIRPVIGSKALNVNVRAVGQPRSDLSGVSLQPVSVSRAGDLAPASLVHRVGGDGVAPPLVKIGPVMPPKLSPSSIPPVVRTIRPVPDEIGTRKASSGTIVLPIGPVERRPLDKAKFEELDRFIDGIGARAERRGAGLTQEQPRVVKSREPEHRVTRSSETASHRPPGNPIHEIEKARAFVARVKGKAIHVGILESGLITPHPLYWSGNGLTMRGLSDPQVQSELVVMEARQVAYMKHIHPILRDVAEARMLIKGTAAIIAALPEEERERASDWSKTGVWSKLTGLLVKEGAERSLRALRKWQEARAKRDVSRYAKAAKASIQIDSWPIDVTPQDRRELEQDSVRHRKMMAASQLAARQNSLGI